MSELAVSDIYACIIGDAYGSVTSEGVSATECEYDEATRLGLPRLVFVKGMKDTSRDPRQTAFLNKVSPGLVRSRFATIKQLLSSLTTTLDAYLAENKTVMRPVFDEKGHQVGQKTSEVGQKPITNRSEPITNLPDPITNGRLDLPDDFDQRMAANRKDLREWAKRIWLRIAHDADVTVRDLASECGFSIASTQGFFAWSGDRKGEWMSQGKSHPSQPSDRLRAGTYRSTERILIDYLKSLKEKKPT